MLRNRKAQLGLLPLLTLSIFTLGLVLVGGLGYQYTASEYEARKYPPAGQLVDVSGSHLHICCQGNGSPTVVLESGLGANSLAWAMVQPKVAQLTRVCSYDRAGSGWSQSISGERTGAVMVEELHQLLANAGIGGPYIIVGHSFGGILARLFAQRFSAEVEGLVLVDSSHEDQIARFNISSSNSIWERPWVVGIKAGLGWTRLQSKFGELDASWARFPAETREAYIATLQRTDALVAAAREDAGFATTLQQMKDQNGPIGRKPLIVITAGKMDAAGPEPTAEEISDDKIWYALQQDLAAKSPVSKHWIAKQSGHSIPTYQPDIIVDAVHDIWSQLGLASNPEFQEQGAAEAGKK